MKIRYSGEESEQTEIHSLKGKLPPSNGVWERGGGGARNVWLRIWRASANQFYSASKKRSLEIAVEGSFFFFCSGEGRLMKNKEKISQIGNPNPWYMHVIVGAFCLSRTSYLRIEAQLGIVLQIPFYLVLKGNLIISGTEINKEVSTFNCS